MNGAPIAALKEAVDLLEAYSKFGSVRDIQNRNAELVALRIQNEKLTAELERQQKVIDRLNRRIDALQAGKRGGRV